MVSSKITLLPLVSRSAWLGHAWTLAGCGWHRHHTVWRHPIRHHSILGLKDRCMSSSCLATQINWPSIVMSFHLASLHTLQADVSKSSFKVESHLLSHSQKVESGVWRNVLLLPRHRTTGCKGYQTSVTQCNGERSRANIVA